MTTLEPLLAIDAAVEPLDPEINEELYHKVVTFHGGRMVRIEYFGEWSEALQAAGLSE